MRLIMHKGAMRRTLFPLFFFLLLCSAAETKIWYDEIDSSWRLPRTKGGDAQGRDYLLH